MDAHNKCQITYNLLSQELPFIRPIYRTLFSRRRTYAAFETEQLLTILGKLKPTGTVLDPMSGYGVLAEVCRERNIPTCSMEINPPSYLWQVLLEPNNKRELLLACEALIYGCKNIRTTKDFEASDTWFPRESVSILKQLWHRSSTLLSNTLKNDKGETYLAAVLLPFLGRLSSHSEGTINIQVKKSGLVFYQGWKDDLKKYLSLISRYLIEKYENNSVKNEILFLNSLNKYEMDKKFSYMITSPPYPTMRDYYSFFFPENYALEEIFRPEQFSFINIRENVIGSAKVSSFKRQNAIDFDLLSSDSARTFLTDLKNWKGTKRSVDDNISYYIPYYFSYFLHLEKAYSNVERILNNKFDGYIIVVNNTARKFVIPVAQVVKEIWNNLGCNAEEDKSFTNERTHVGSINPRAIGFKARHMEYAIRVNRG